jgi:hypothetical protein
VTRDWTYGQNGTEDTQTLSAIRGIGKYAISNAIHHHQHSLNNSLLGQMLTLLATWWQPDLALPAQDLSNEERHCGCFTFRLGWGIQIALVVCCRLALLNALKIKSHTSSTLAYKNDNSIWLSGTVIIQVSPHKSTTCGSLNPIHEMVSQSVTYWVSLTMLTQVQLLQSNNSQLVLILFTIK